MMMMITPPYIKRVVIIIILQGTLAGALLIPCAPLGGAAGSQQIQVLQVVPSNGGAHGIDH